MAILSIQFGQVGAVPVANANNSLPAAQQTPQIVYIATNDTTATVTAAGYLNQLTQNTTDGFTFNNTQMALVYTTDNGPQFYQISVALTGIITLVPDVNPGNVLLPVLVNHIAAFSNVAGQIADPNATIISKSLIQSGVNNSTAGGFIAIPAGNNQGSLRIIPVANAGGFNSILSNTAVGQATTYSLPDPGGAAAQLILNNSAGTQTIATGNLALTVGSVTATANNFIAGNAATPNAGNFQSFPAASGGANDKFVFAAVTSGGNFTTTFSNRAMGQSTTVGFTDPVNAAGSLLIGAGATPFVNGNFPVNSGTAGLMVDSGKAANTLLAAGFATPDTNANVVRFDITCGQAALAAGGHVALITSSGTKQYKIVNLWINSGGTNFSGGGGDRLGQVSDGTTVYSVIPAATMQTLVNAGWGIGAALPFPAAAAINTSTVAGANLFFAYSGGTTDYTAGSVVVSGVAVRVA